MSTTDWQPMETAPAETETRVLVSVEGETVIGYRNSFYEGSPWWCCEDDGPVSWGGIEPDGWMLLPEAIQTEDSAK